MKNLLILGLILIFDLQSTAQIGHYYQNVQSNYSDIIVKSNGNLIETQDLDLYCIYWFTELGICDRIVMQWDDQSYSYLQYMLSHNDNLTWSERDDFWYNYIVGQDNNSYFVVTSVFIDKNGKAYIDIQLKFKTR